jgi:hypothetical protein
MDAVSLSITYASLNDPSYAPATMYREMEMRFWLEKAEAELKGAPA